MTDTRPSAFTSVPSSVRDTVPGTTIRFFISSTFADFQIERDVLQRKVFPELRKLCASSGFRFQPIDLRWGVSEAAGTDRQTLRICFDELEHCRQLSADCFLLILLGERYGSYILPPQVPATLIEQMLLYLRPEEREQFASAYRLDENAVPPEYVLLRVEGPEQAEDEHLRQVLVRASQAAELTEADRLLFEGSATHREVQLGLLGEPPGLGQEDGVLCATRTFAGTQVGPARITFSEQDTERTRRLQQMTEAILARLPQEQVAHYSVVWDGEQGPVFDQDALAEAYLRLLRPKLEAVIAARTAAGAAAEARGRDAMSFANAAFEQERAAHVEGRDAELAQLATYLTGETGAGLPLVVTGAAGSGKSTLLAEAATRTTSAQPGAALITRYIGVTPGTGSLSDVLNGLRRAIAQAYSLPEPAPLLDENQLISAVASELATLSVPPDRPLLVVLDALDQLGARTQRTDWLPPKLAPGVHVVVSVLAERPELGYLQIRVPVEQVLTLAPLSRDAGRAMLRDLLSASPSRTLTSAQEDAVLDAFAAQGLPLFLRLMASAARRWRSFDSPLLGKVRLPVTIPELLQTMLEQLEAPERNGRMLVARTLGDLAAARYGLAEDELLDLLSRDQAVREDLHHLAPMSPPIDQDLPLPVALWARLSAEIEPLVTERETDKVRLFTFYHQQLRTAVEARYLTGTERVARHQALADYFAVQPWQLGPKQWNWRKVQEQVSQQEGAGERGNAEQTLAGLAETLERVEEQPREGEQADLEGITGLVAALQDHLGTGGFWRVGQRLYTIQLAAVRAMGDRANEGATLNSLGALADTQGRSAEAAGYYEQALAIAREIGNGAGEGRTLHNLGNLADTQGRPAEAAGYYEQALAILREIGNRAGEGTALVGLGNLANNQGRSAEAAGYYEQALAILREIGDRAGEGTALHNLGNLADKQGQPAEAAGYYEQALAIAREVGDRAGEGTALNNLGNLADKQGQPAEAAGYYEQALAIAREVGNRAGEGTALYNLGLFSAQLKRTDQARGYFVQARTAFEEIGALDDAQDARKPIARLGSRRWWPFGRRGNASG